MRTRIGGVAAVVTICLLAMVAPATAKTFSVNRLGDDTPGQCNAAGCTLREAVIAANARTGDDVIVLPGKGPYELAIENTAPGGEDAALEGDLDLESDLVIRHSGRGRATVDANDIDRVFDTLPGSSVTLSKLTVRGGLSPDWGGGIRSEGRLEIIGTSVRGNESEEDGGGVGFPESTGSLVLRNASMAGNHSHDDGGAISFGDDRAGRLVIANSRITGNESDDWGGGLISAVPVTITRTTIAGNTADGSAGGLAIEGPDLPSTIRSSTISGNRSSENGGGLVADGTPGRVTVVNTTIAGNSTTGQGGGIWGDDARFQINAATIARNKASGDGGGVFASFTRVALGNSVLALNSTGENGPNCNQEGDQGIDTLGRNVFANSAGCPAAGDSDLVSGNPKIGRLSRNGGPTKTIPLKAGSPAIGFAKPKTAPGTDQRGHKRGKDPDSGAFER